VAPSTGQQCNLVTCDVTSHLSAARRLFINWRMADGYV